MLFLVIYFSFITPFPSFSILIIIEIKLAYLATPLLWSNFRKSWDRPAGCLQWHLKSWNGLSKSSCVRQVIRDLQIRRRVRVNFWAREAWVLAVVDTIVAVVSSQPKFFSNFCEYDVITFCQSRERLVDKQHKMPQSRQNIARQVARNISQCICEFKD